MQRIRVFFEAYGVKGIDAGFFEMVLLRVKGLYQSMIRMAGRWDKAFQRMIDKGHHVYYQEVLRFSGKHGEEWVSEYAYSCFDKLCYLYCSHSFNLHLISEVTKNCLA